MLNEVTESQRLISKEAAKIANAAIRGELANPKSPITQVVSTQHAKLARWIPYWNPFIVSWVSKSGFGLQLRDSDAVMLNSNAAYERANEIVAESMKAAMIDKAHVWVGPMLRDLISEKSFYQKLVVEDAER